MSVLIKGMTMPRHCTECLFCKRSYDEAMNYVDFICIVDGTTCKISSCPLIPIPDHGDLIDKNELMKHKQCVYKFGEYKLYAVATDTILKMPVVIPAERSEDWEEPEINPCRGCDDYDGVGGCKSHGGCGAERSEDAQKAD